MSDFCVTKIFLKVSYFILFIIYNIINIHFIGFHSLFSGSYSDDFGEIIQFYLDTNEQTVLSELHLWHAILKKNEEHPKNGLEALRLCKQELFPNIHRLLLILCTLPVSTATPERTFSCLNRLKSYLRSTMTEVFILIHLIKLLIILILYIIFIIIYIYLLIL